MAIKPSTAPPVYASLDDYAAIALVPVALQGSATKVDPAGDRVTNGQIPSVPPFAQHENFMINLLTLWSIWVSEGEEIKLASPHIQETNEDGLIFAIGADLGLFDVDTTPLAVRPNDQQTASEHGMLCETQIDSPASGALFQDIQTADPLVAFELRCHGTGSKAPMLIDAAFDAGSGVGDRPAVEIIANNPIGRGALELNPIRSTAIRIRQSGTGLGAPAIDVQTGDSSTPIYAKQLDGNQPSARLEAFDGGTNKGAPLLLVPQIFVPTGSGAQTGSMWMNKLVAISDHFAPQFRGSQTRHIAYTRFPYCHARGEAIGVTVSDADPDTWKSIVTFSFPDDLVPHVVGPVRVHITGRVARNSTADVTDMQNGLYLQMIDVTDTDAVIHEWIIDIAALDTGGNNNIAEIGFSVYHDYTLPDTGERTFRAEFKKNPTESNANLLLAQDVFCRVDALP